MCSSLNYQTQGAQRTTSEAFACCPFGYPRERIAALGRDERWAKKWAEDSPPYLIGLKDQVWRVSRVGSVPRKQGGGGDQWMRSTSRNVRAMRRQERSLDLAQSRALHPAAGQRVGGCKKGIYPNVFQLTPRLLKTQTQAPRPLLKPAMDYLGLKGGQRGEGESKESPTQKGDPSPLQRPFRNKINGMCLSITPRELGGEG